MCGFSKNEHSSTAYDPTFLEAHASQVGVLSVTQSEFWVSEFWVSHFSYSL